MNVVNNNRTKRDRLLHVFEPEEGIVPVGKRYIPLSPFIHHNFIYSVFGTVDIDLIEKTIDIYQRYGFDLMHRNIDIRYGPEAFSGENWEVKTETITDQKSGNGGEKVFVTIRTPEKTLRQITSFSQLTPNLRVKAVIEGFIKQPDDFEQFVKYRPSPDKIDIDFSQLMRAQDLIGDKGITAPWGFGVFNYVSEKRKLDDLCLDMISNETFYRDMMRYFTDEIVSFYRKLAGIKPDVVSYPGNIANGKLVGPDFFHRFIMEYEKDAIKLLQSAGVHVLYHNCGNAVNMIDVYNELGISGFETMTEKPHGDMELDDCLKRFSPEITLVGNIDQIDFLRTASVEEVRADTVSRLEKAAAAGRAHFILGTSDFLEEGTPEKNLYAMTEAVEQWRKH